MRELAVVAQDTTAYGRDVGTSIVELLSRLADLGFPGFAYCTRIHEHYDELLELLSERTNLVKYVDLPCSMYPGMYCET